LSRIGEFIALFDAPVSRGRFGALVGVWVALLLGAVNIRVFHNDNIPNVLLPLSLARDGDFELSEFETVLEREPEGERYWAVRSDTGLYSKYPIWTGVLVAPLFAPLAGWDAQLCNDYFWLGYGRLVALLLSAVFAGTLAAALRSMVSGRWAVFLTFSAVLGSALWHHLGSHLTNQVLPNVCIALVLLMLFGSKMSARRAVAVGLLAGLCVAARLPSLFVAGLPLGVFLTRRSWRRFVPLVVLGGLLFPVLTMLYNSAAFGGPLTTGYSYYAKDAFTGQGLEGAAGLLLSPTCGLLFYSPFLIVGVWVGFGCLRRRLPHDPGGLGGWVFAGTLCQWLLFSKWWCWNGALTFGSRMMAETVPGLVLLIGLAWPVLGAKLWVKRVLLWSGGLAMLHHLVGTIAYDAIAPLNPLKSDWRIGEDFIALFVGQFGLIALLKEVAVQGGILVILFAVGGYYVSRFFLPQSVEVLDSDRRVLPTNVCVSETRP